MAERKPSSVAAYLRSGDRPAAVAWAGGRGRRGPLGAWLLREKAAILEGRAAVPALTWREVARLAAADGVTRPDGSPYAERDVSRAWSNLASREPVPRAVAAARGGTAPPAPTPPAAPIPARSGEPAAGREPERPRRGIHDMPPRRRFGDR